MTITQSQADAIARVLFSEYETNPDFRALIDAKVGTSRECAKRCTRESANPGGPGRLLRPVTEARTLPRPGRPVPQRGVLVAPRGQS